MNMKRDKLIKVYDQVIEDIKNGGYYCNGEFIEFDSHDIKSGTVMYKNLGIIPKSRRQYFNNPKIYVKNIDSFLAAIELGPGSAVLNMASSIRPGGGVANGSMAQEEELCRRSDLLYSLYSFTDKGEIFDFIQESSKYPIPKYGGIYSPRITIYREPGTYKSMYEPKKCSVISVAGIVRPYIFPETGEMSEGNAGILRGKIRTILRIAILHGHTSLVLGALGCGAFRNPPKQVAKLFKEVLSEEEFSHSFSEICFAILEDINSIRLDNPDGNFKPFVDIFGEKK